MLIREIGVFAFRNLQDIAFSPSIGLNVICGENGQGKTNLLEAVWLFTGARSFRTAKESEMIPFCQDSAKISLVHTSCGMESETAVWLGAHKRIVKNGVDMPSLASLAGSFCAVVFSPAHLSLVQGPSAERRKMADTTIVQLKPRYLSLTANYVKLIAQRNALLGAKNSYGAKDQLEVWDEAAAVVGCRIVKTRRSYTDKLGESAAQWYKELSCNREKLSLTYRAAGGEEGQTEEPQGFLQALQRSRESDWARGFTTVGPHRDDIEIKIDGKPARVFASQGQRRTAVLALKMAECALMEQTLGESPVMLLDDVLSELDEQRRSVLLKSLENRQSFLTGCDDFQIKNVTSVCCMNAGKLRQLT